MLHYAEKPPEGIGLNLVLSILLSIPLSCHIFKIAAPEAPIAIKIKDIALMKKLLSEGAIIIAHKAVNITSEITPGFISIIIDKTIHRSFAFISCILLDRLVFYVSKLSHYIT